MLYILDHVDYVVCNKLVPLIDCTQSMLDPLYTQHTSLRQISTPHNILTISVSNIRIMYSLVIVHRSKANRVMH